MRRYLYIILFAFCAQLVFTPTVEAKNFRNDKNTVWGKKPSKKNGLYTTKNFFISHGISVNVNAMYYFGDVDNEGLAFHGGFNPKNLSFGGGIIFAYTMPASTHCNLRYSLMGGTLSGNNELKFQSLPEPRDDYRSFKSFMIQPAFGVEIYPFSVAGFYIYAGVAVTASIITDYQFYYYKKVPGMSEKQRTLLQGKTFGILPMAQLGIGYSWRLSSSWALSAEIMLEEGLIDQHYMNLDGWPMAGSQNSDGVDLGGSGLTYINKNGGKSLHWNDGWFQVGITISYRWNNCENCAIINNYHRIRGLRR